MKILALEFSTARRSVAIVDAAQQMDEPLCEVVETGGRETKAFGMIEEALRRTKVERGQIECVTVGLGPGSYNGIRVAIAIAQGWQLASKVKLVGISSVDVLAAQAQADGLRGRAHFIVDAQRNEIYWASFELTEQHCKPLQALRLVRPDEVKQELTEGDLLLGPEATKWFTEGQLFYPRAFRLGMLAKDRNDFLSAEALEPIYLRETSFIKAPKPRSVI
jgi:tRNA threonylcarbamoyl adenosine modification protein YeaZ